jgi:hypothetical protein
MAVVSKHSRYGVEQLARADKRRSPILLGSILEKLMAKSVDWESRIGRRVRCGTCIFCSPSSARQYGQAAGPLGLTQSAVSVSCCAGARAQGSVVDRSPRGVEPTIYATAMLRRGRVALDELRLGQDIEFLADRRSAKYGLAALNRYRPEFWPSPRSCTEPTSGGVGRRAIERF